MKILFDRWFDLEPHAQERPRVRVIQKKGEKAFATVYDPPRSKKFKEDIIRLLTLDKPDMIIDEPMIMSCKVFIKRPKTVVREYPEVKPDLSNYIKGIEDGMNKIVYTDDSKIIGYDGCRKYYGIKPGFQVTLYRV